MTAKEIKNELRTLFVKNKYDILSLMIRTISDRRKGSDIYEIELTVRNKEEDEVDGKY